MLLPFLGCNGNISQSFVYYPSPEKGVVDPAMSYSVEAIDVIERDKLIEKYAERVLFENKADIYGCFIKLLTDGEDTKER